MVDSKENETFDLGVKGLNSLQWPIYVFNSVVNTKLPVILSHHHHSFFRNLSSFYLVDCSFGRQLTNDSRVQINPLIEK